MVNICLVCKKPAPEIRDEYPTNNKEMKEIRFRLNHIDCDKLCLDIQCLEMKIRLIQIELTELEYKRFCKSI